MSSQRRACFSSFPPLIWVSLPSSSTLLLPFQILIKAHQPRPTGSKTPVQQDYGITQPGSRPVKALCSNQRAAQEAGGTQESELEFVRRSDAAQAFCEQRRRFLSASELLKAGSTAKKKMIIHVFTGRIPLSWNAEIACVSLCVRVCVSGPELPFASLRVAELIRLLPQQLPLCAATWIHFCGNPMPLIKTVAIVPP